MKKNYDNKLKPAGTVAFMMLATVFSKLLGMLRVMLFARRFGTGAEANAFTAASHIPLTFFDLLFSAAILGCFIPVYNSFSASDGKNAPEENGADRFASVFINTIIFLTGILAVLGIIFAENLVNLMTPGLDAETKALAAKLLRLMFPMVVFTGATYTLVGVMQSRGRYMLPAMISSVSNAGVIIYLLLVPTSDGKAVYGLAAAYLAAWLIQLATLAVPLLAAGFKYKPALDFRNPALIQAMKRLPPVMVGSWLIPLSLMLGLFFSSLVAENVSAFDYAQNIYIIITGTLTYSICNYIFPKLSRLSASGDGGSFDSAVRTSLTVSAFITIPFAAAVFILCGEGTAVIFMYGRFDAASAAMTAGIIRVMSIGMPFFMVNEMLSRVFYSKKEVKPPVFASLAGIAVNIAVSVAAVSAAAATPGTSDIRFIAAAYMSGQAASAIVLLFALNKKLRGVFTGGFAANTLKILISGALAFAAMAALYALIGNNPFAAGLVANIITAAAVFACGAAVYLAASFMLRVKLTKL